MPETVLLRFCALLYLAAQRHAENLLGGCMSSARHSAREIIVRAFLDRLKQEKWNDLQPCSNQPKFTNARLGLPKETGMNAPRRTRCFETVSASFTKLEENYRGDQTKQERIVERIAHRFQT